MQVLKETLNAVQLKFPIYNTGGTTLEKRERKKNFCNSDIVKIDLIWTRHNTIMLKHDLTK
jgi:hypothetical protein